MPIDISDALFKAIDARREELVELTRRLIRFPTVNPPGEAYQPCAEFIGRRLAARGFAIDYVRAEGTPGDSDRYPRINVIARREGGGPGPACISTATSTWCRPEAVGPWTRSRGCSGKARCSAAVPAT